MSTSSCWQPRSHGHHVALVQLKDLTIEMSRALVVPGNKESDRILAAEWSRWIDLVAKFGRQPRSNDAPTLDPAEARTLWDHADRAALVRHALQVHKQARGIAQREAAAELLRRRLTWPLEQLGPQ